MNFTPIGLQVPRLLLPRADVDLAQWAVVACDQYTSQPDYWAQVEALVGKSRRRIAMPNGNATIEVLARDEVVPDPDNWILKKD